MHHGGYLNPQNKWNVGSDSFIIAQNINHNRERGYFLKPYYTFYTLTIQSENKERWRLSTVSISPHVYLEGHYWRGFVCQTKYELVISHFFSYCLKLPFLYSFWSRIYRLSKKNLFISEKGSLMINKHFSLGHLVQYQPLQYTEPFPFLMQYFHGACSNYLRRILEPIIPKSGHSHGKLARFVAPYMQNAKCRLTEYEKITFSCYNLSFPSI